MALPTPERNMNHLHSIADQMVRNDRFDRIAWLARLAAAGLVKVWNVEGVTFATCEFCNIPTPAIHQGYFIGEAAHLISQRTLIATLGDAIKSGNKYRTYHDTLVRFACRKCNLEHGDIVPDPR